MHPWFSWLRWINWIYYGFECLMSNEFYNLELQCVPPFLVPQGPGAYSGASVVFLAGSQPGSTLVSGEAYIESSFTYSRSHLWRNFGFLWAFFAFFLAITMIGMEMMKPNSGGAATTVFKRGPGAQDTPEKPSRRAAGPRATRMRSPVTASRRRSPASRTSKEQQAAQDAKALENVACNETIFTFQRVNYTILLSKGRERKLLQNVQGFVRPGRLTALMGASGAGKTIPA